MVSDPAVTWVDGGAETVSGNDPLVVNLLHDKQLLIPLMRSLPALEVLLDSG